MSYSEVCGRLEDLSKTDRSRLTRLLGTAQLSDRKSRHAAAAYRGGSLLAVGINTTRVNSPYMETNGVPYPSEHAEEAVLRQIRDPEGTTVYVVRARRDGYPGLSRPCPRCSQLLRESGCKKVVYTVNEYPVP